MSGGVDKIFFSRKKKKERKRRLLFYIKKVRKIWNLMSNKNQWNMNEGTRTKKGMKRFCVMHVIGRILINSPLSLFDSNKTFVWNGGWGATF